MDQPSCWRVTAKGIVLRVPVAPKSSRDEVAGLADTAADPPCCDTGRRASSDVKKRRVTRSVGD